MKDLFKYEILKRKLNEKGIQHQRFVGTDGLDCSTSPDRKEKALREVIDKYRDSELYEPLLRAGGNILNIDGAGAMRSRGAMGCLFSHREIIQDAIDNKYKKILIFQDDIYFHKQFEELLEDLKSSIESGAIIHLGATEFKAWMKKTKWRDPNWSYKQNKYSPTDQTCGMFGVIISEEVFVPFMELSRFNFFAADRALSFLASTTFHGSSYVARPNLVIQDVSFSGTSKKLSTYESGKQWKPMVTEFVLGEFGWNLDYYDLRERYYDRS